MPQVINGIGTWYYGKNRIHTIRSECEFCNAYGDLRSYDTTKYFVVFFIPLIPLKTYRVLSDCPFCRKHRALPSKEWEAAKGQAIAGVTQRIDRDVNDSAGVIDAIRVAVTFQDEGLLLKVAEHLAAPMTDHADVQNALGDALSYFSRDAEAETAYRCSLQVKDEPLVRRALAVKLLRQNRPDEADAFLKPIIYEDIPSNVGMFMLLIEGFQGQANHSKAMELLSLCETAVPEMKTDKSYRDFRKQVEKNAKSGRPAKLVSLDTSNSGYQTGGSASKFAKMIGPLAALVTILAYLGSAIYIGQNRTVQLVNGSSKPYQATINGKSFDLAPQSHRRVRLSEGRLSIVLTGNGLDVPPTEVSMQSPFWSRPFVSRTIVINPDRLALIHWEQAFYVRTGNQAPTGSSQLYVGQALYEFSRIDYPFEPFPTEIKMNATTPVGKTRVDVLPPGQFSPMEIMAWVSSQVGKESTVDYLRNRVIFEPENVIFHELLAQMMPPGQLVEFLKGQLDEVPVIVAVHRTYQRAMEVSQPEYDLAADYRRRLDADPKNAELAYLLARVVREPNEHERLLALSTEGVPPSAFGNASKAYNLLARGDFADALPYAETALRLQPDSDMFEQTRRMAWKANGRHDDLLKEAREKQQLSTFKLPYIISEVEALISMDDFEGAKTRIEEFQTSGRILGGFDPMEQKQVADNADTILRFASYFANDRKKYLEIARKSPDLAATEMFALHVTAGDFDAARMQLQSKDRPLVWKDHLLLYIAYSQAGNEMAAQQDLDQAIDILQRDAFDERQLAAMLKEKTPPNPVAAEGLRMYPTEKRVALTALGLRTPAHRERYFALASKLNFDPAFPRLFLQDILLDDFPRCGSVALGRRLPP